MARPLRIEFPGALYHVTSRGNGGENIYCGDGDRTMFLQLLARVWERFNWTVHAYCLMTNHYHLLIETPDGNLAKGMRELNGIYTQRFNRVNKRAGHLFQGRYKAILVEKEVYLLEVARYIVLNPVRASMVRSAADYTWSSYSAMVREVEVPKWLESRVILANFANNEAEAVDAYRHFVAEDTDRSSPWKDLQNQVFLGSEDFVDAMHRKISPGRDLREIPQAKRRPAAGTLAEYENAHQNRDDAIVAAYGSGAYSMREIGDYFELHYSRISRIIDRVRRL